MYDWSGQLYILVPIVLTTAGTENELQNATKLPTGDIVRYNLSQHGSGYGLGGQAQF